jgi:WD40 repeat protein
VASHQPIGQPLQGHSAYVSSVAFSPDGRSLASGSGDHNILLWNVNPEIWAEETCQRAGRNFTRAEWGIYLPDEPYPTKQKGATCSQWPLEPETTLAAQIS